MSGSKAVENLKPLWTASNSSRRMKPSQVLICHINEAIYQAAVENSVERSRLEHIAETDDKYTQVTIKRPITAVEGVIEVCVGLSVRVCVCVHVLTPLLRHG